MLTAKDGDLDEAEALDTGADDYLTKPFSFPVLVARMRALLRRAGGTIRDRSRSATLRMDSAARRVWSRARRSTLTAPRVRRARVPRAPAGQVLSQGRRSWPAVWELDFAGDPNIVEVYVGRLRRKLDEPFGTRHIVTVRAPAIASTATVAERRLVSGRSAAGSPRWPPAWWSPCWWWSRRCWS